jgi:hypothetical protein
LVEPRQVHHRERKGNDLLQVIDKLSTVTANKMKHKNIQRNQKYKKYFLNDFGIFRNGM